jgi:hypothetical protein
MQQTCLLDKPRGLQLDGSFRRVTTIFSDPKRTEEADREH